MRPSRSHRRADRGAIRAALVGCLLLPAGAWPLSLFGAQQSVRSESSTRESATFLLAPLGARTVALGGAAAAARDVPEAVLWNPAAAASLGSSEVYYLNGNDFGTETHVFGGIWRQGGQAIGVAYERFSLGELEATGPGGAQLGTLDLRNEAVVATFGMTLPRGVEAGISYKLVRFVSRCTGSCAEFDFSGTGHAFDLGVAARTDRGAVALVLRNAGDGLSLGDGAPSDPLPTRLRAGLTTRILGEEGGSGPILPVSVTLSADFEETWPEFDDLDVFVGAEVGVGDRLFGRLGHAWQGDGRTGPALGVGLRLDRLRLDVGRAFDDFAEFDGDAPLHLSLGVRF